MTTNNFRMPLIFRYIRDRRGVSAVAVDRKVSLTAAALTNLASQSHYHQHGGYDKHSQRVVGNHRALSGEQAEGDIVG